MCFDQTNILIYPSIHVVDMDLFYSIPKNKRWFNGRI